MKGESKRLGKGRMLFRNASTMGREKRDKMVVFLNLCREDWIALGGRGARYQSGQSKLSYRGE